MPPKPTPDERALLLALFDETTQFLDVAMPMASIHERLFEVHAKYKGNEQGILEETAYVEELLRLADAQSAKATVRRCLDHLGKYLSDDVLATSRAAAKKTLSKIHVRELFDQLGIPRDKIKILDPSPIDPDLLRPMVIDVLRLRGEIWAKLESPPETPVEAMDRFIFEEKSKGTPPSKILRAVNATPGWPRLAGISSLDRPTDRHAKKIGKPIPPKSNRGRKPKG